MVSPRCVLRVGIIVLYFVITRFVGRRTRVLLVRLLGQPGRNKMSIFCFRLMYEKMETDRPTGLTETYSMNSNGPKLPLPELLSFKAKGRGRIWMTQFYVLVLSPYVSRRTPYVDPYP